MGIDLEVESQTSALGRTASPENTLRKAGHVLLNVAKSET